MKEEQIQQLKQFMAMFKNSQGEVKELNKSDLIAYLAGCLDGIN